jgi:hypothetical protein
VDWAGGGVTADQLYEIAEAAVVRPGDTLVISFAELDLQQADGLRAHITQRLGDRVQVLIIGNAISLHVLRHEDAASPEFGGSSAAGSVPPD